MAKIRMPKKIGEYIARKREEWHNTPPINRIDRYLIKKFIGTYFFSILLIIAIVIVFDFNEKIDKLTVANKEFGISWGRIFTDYYLNTIPYFANLFSSLFVFISVIFFTSKLADRSEIIAMRSNGMSFRRILRPYIISALLNYPQLTVSQYFTEPARLLDIPEYGE